MSPAGRTARGPSGISIAAARGSLPAAKFAAACAVASSGPDGGTPAWSQPGRPASCTVVPGAAARSTSAAIGSRSARCAARLRNEANAIARREEGRGLTSGIEESRMKNAPDDPPAARRSERVDAGVVPGDTEASRLDARARHRSSRYHETRVDRCEVRETGHEPHEPDHAFSRRMKLDPLARTK